MPRRPHPLWLVFKRPSFSFLDLTVFFTLSHAPVDNKRGKCLAVDVFGHNDKWLLHFVGHLESGDDRLYGRDLLLAEQAKGVVVLYLGSCVEKYMFKVRFCRVAKSIRVSSFCFPGCLGPDNQRP